MIATLETKPPGVEAPLQMDHLSASSIKDYLGCPLRFFFSRIARLEKPVSPSLHLGKAVHAGIERANRLQFRNESVSEEAVMTAYHECFDDTESDYATGWRDSDQQLKLRLTGERLLKAFLESSVFHEQPRPLGVEVQLRSTVPGTTTELLGYIDRVNPDGCPVDYKTVACTPNVEQELWQHELQLVAYCELIEAATGNPVPGMELVFLVKNKSPKIIRVTAPPPTACQRQRLWSLFNVVCRGIEEERFHPQPGTHCNWCPYRQECAQCGGTGGAS